MISDEKFKSTANDLGCSEAAVRAVGEVESGRYGGFSAPNRPVVLFEGHWFYKLTKGKYAETHPTLCYPKWTKQHYAKNQEDEWLRFHKALALDRTAALLSTSFGRFQVMGFNHAKCSYSNVETFFADMCKSEDYHLEAFEQFVKNSGLADELQRLDWAGFAKAYNGAGFKENAYDTKLQKAYEKYKKLGYV